MIYFLLCVPVVGDPGISVNIFPLEPRARNAKLTASTNDNKKSEFSFGEPLPQGPRTVSPCNLALPETALKSQNVQICLATRLDDPLQPVGAELPATNRLPRWRIGERPPDMEVSCELSRHMLSDK